MSREYSAFDLFLVAVAAIVGFMLPTLLGVGWHSGDYKQGQIDALTGRVHFELVTKPDSTKVWQEISTQKQLDEVLASATKRIDTLVMYRRNLPSNDTNHKPER